MYNSSSLANAPVSVLPHEIPMRCYPVVRRRCIDPLNNSARGARWTASSQMADHIRRGVARWAGRAGAAGSCVPQLTKQPNHSWQGLYIRAPASGSNLERGESPRF